MNPKSEQYMLSKIHEALDPLDPERYRKKAYNMRDKYGNRLWGTSILYV